MKWNISTFTVLAALALVSPRGARAQASSEEQPPGPTYERSNAPSAAALAAQSGTIARSSDIVGMEVRNLQGQKLGKVENLIVDLHTGRVVQVIVSSGGFLGIGDELSAVPPMAFHYDPQQKLLQLDVSRDALAKAPHFKSKEWPNLTDPAYADEVYRAYHVTPYSRMTAADADNTKQNVVDRQGGTVTPFDQGSSKADLEITRQIRKEIRKQNALSVDAQNIKIITANGQVTLRGPVNSDSEKELLADIATRVAHNQPVNNQLIVKRSGKE